MRKQHFFKKKNTDSFFILPESNSCETVGEIFLCPHVKESSEWDLSAAPINVSSTICCCFHLSVRVMKGEIIAAHR